MSKRRSLEEVRAYIEENERHLNSCQHHEFQKPDNDSFYNFVYVCRHCGGRVDQTAKMYYEIGYAHGKLGEGLNEDGI